MKAGTESDREREQPTRWACWTLLEVDSAATDHQQGDIIQAQPKPCCLWGALCLLVPPDFLPIPHKFLVKGSLSLDNPLLLCLGSVGKFCAEFCPFPGQAEITLCLRDWQKSQCPVKMSLQMVVH